MNVTDLPMLHVDCRIPEWMTIYSGDVDGSTIVALYDQEYEIHVGFGLELLSRDMIGHGIQAILSARLNRDFGEAALAIHRLAAECFNQGKKLDPSWKPLVNRMREDELLVTRLGLRHDSRIEVFDRYLELF